MAVVNVKSEIAGNVWKIQLKPGDKVEVEGEIMILEIDEDGDSRAVPQSGHHQGNQGERR